MLEMGKNLRHTAAGALQNTADLVEAQSANRMAMGARRDLGQGHIFLPLPFFLYFYTPCVLILLAPCWFVAFFSFLKAKY